MVSVSPAFIKVPVPSTGIAGEGMKIATVNNNTDKKIAFKMKGTRLDLYEVDPPFGFVAPKANVRIKIQPRKFNSPGTNKNDHFSVLIIPAPDGVANIKDVWKPADASKAPKNPRRFTIIIKYISATVAAADAESSAASSAEGTDTDATETTGDDKYEDEGDEDDESKKDKKKPGKEYVFLDDEKTEPPDDLKEVPEFMEWKFRRYD